MIKVEKRMLFQNTRYLNRKRFPSVIKALSVGKWNDQSIVVLGVQNNYVYILNSKFKLLQKIKFHNWPRCIACGDITRDGKSEIIIGSGDCHLYLFSYDEKCKKYTQYAIVEFDDFVDSCAIGDITGDGFLEIVAGSWDKSVRAYKYLVCRKKPSNNINNSEYSHRKDENQDIFKENISQGRRYVLKEIWRQNFERGIHKCKIADVNWNGKENIVILLKEYGMKTLNGANGEIIWEFNNGNKKQLNDCAVSPFDLSGYPYLVVGGNDKKLYFFNTEGENVHTIPINKRISALKAHCIDGGDHPEIMVGTTTRKGKSLKVFELRDTGLNSLQEKWTLKIGGVINSIEVADINRDGQEEILFGGYNCTLSNIQDSQFERKPDLGISVPETALPEVSMEISQADVPFESNKEYIFDMGEEEVLVEAAAEQSLFRKGNDVVSEETVAPVSEKPTTESVPEKGIGKEKAVAVQSSQGEKITDFEDKQKEITKISEIDDRGDKKGTADAYVSVRKAIGQVFEEEPVISRKNEVIEKLDGRLKGFEGRTIFDFATQKNFIEYSSSGPKGYRLVKPESQKIKEKEEVPSIPSAESFEDKIRTLFKENPLFSLKAGLLEALDGLVEDKSPKEIYKKAKNNDLIEYSRSKPRGYSLKDVDVKEIIEEREEELVEDLEDKVVAIFKKTPLISRKSELLKRLDGMVENKSPDEIYDLIKDADLIQYSRSKPRGYSFKGDLSEYK